jgi:secreted trypsin-like serine protease
MRSISLAVFSSLLALTACGEATRSELKVTNGEIIQESDRPEVVNLYRRVYQNGQLKGGSTCTGTWIGENTILTAAHCTGDGPSDADGKVSDAEIVVFEVTDHSTMPKKTALVTRVVEVYRNKQWEAKKGYNRYDLAILKTEDKAANERPRDEARLSRVAPLKGEAIEIVGYGYYDMSTFGKKGDDMKRVGRNKIADVSGGFINITGEVKDKTGGATGEAASAGQGDSGGPMFRQGEVIGVASGGGTGGLFARGEASYVDLNTSDSRAFLARFGY